MGIIEERAKRVVSEIFEALSADPQGRSRVDVGRIAETVGRDREAVAFALQRILSSPDANLAGWSVWLVAAQEFERQYGDDSLVVLVESAAAAAGEKLPTVISQTAPAGPPQDQLVVLEMAEADVAAGDAYRMLMLLRLENLTPEMRSKLVGKCTITFPAAGDPRPVQHIPRIRTFVADLHKRMPYFPLFFDFDPRVGTRQVYFGCLADTAATQLMPNGQVGTDIMHPSLLAATQAALVGIQRAYAPLSIDCQACVAAILEPYDPATRRSLTS